MSESSINLSSEERTESERESLMQERRSQPRIPAFCQVLDEGGNFVGVSFDLTCIGICLSLPKSWTQDKTFSIVLKRADQELIPPVAVTVEPLWRRARNHDFDEIGGRIISKVSEEYFQQLLEYCQLFGPSGLFADN